VKQLVFALAFIVATIGCANRAATAPIPGAANQFDSNTYLALATAKGGIDQAKVELANGAFSATISPKVKEAINYAVQSYNIADVTYQAYHTAALSGQATPAQQSAVQNSMNNLNTAVTNISSAKAGQ
jgi:hypothetical protein